jgi:hypothetical protein
MNRLKLLWFDAISNIDPFITLFIIWVVVVNIGFGCIDHQIRIAAQQNEGLYKVMQVRDGLGFLMCGGDQFTYRNQFKWEYAQWLNSPERTWLEKSLFWKTGILWDASDPPDEYQYPPLFSKQ